MKFALALAALASVVALALPAVASAGPYWFYQNYLPNGSGPRTVHKVHDCCANNYNRISWTQYSHIMKFSLIDYYGNWQGVNADPNFGGYDQWIQFDITYPSGWNQGGCNDPDGLYAVWTNCRVGVGL
jgi:hypothetical protein